MSNCSQLGKNCLDKIRCGLVRGDLSLVLGFKFSEIHSRPKSAISVPTPTVDDRSICKTLSYATAPVLPVGNGLIACKDFSLVIFVLVKC